MNYDLAFIGAGKMGGAILSSIIAKEISPEKTIVCDAVEAALERFAEKGCAVTTNLCEAVSARVIFLATKPQDLNGFMDGIAPLLKEGQIVISIAAGKTIAVLREHLGEKPYIVRVMPNLPALVGEGLMAYTPEQGTPDEAVKAAERLLATCGTCVLLDEEHFDAVTALSGSGPAFYAYMMKSMAEGGEKLGLPKEAAELLALKTMLGTARYLSETKQDVTAFIKAVCSPKGTTEAGMRVIEASTASDDIAATLAAAAKRSAELR